MSLNTLQVYGDPKIQQQLMADTINKMMTGRANNTGSFTLEAGVTTTVVSDPAFESSMVPLFTATTANAAGALATMYVSDRSKGSFTITHANTGTTDRTFIYSRWG